MVFASKANPEVFELRVTMFHVKHFQEFLRIILFDVNLIFLLSDGHCRASDEPLQRQLQKSDNRQMYLYFKQKNHIHSINRIIKNLAKLNQMQFGFEVLFKLSLNKFNKK